MKSFKIFAIILVTIMMAFASRADARNGFSFATGVMAMTNSTVQGGQGSKGSTLLTQTDFSYHHGWWGWGVFAQYDKQGDSEVDTSAGPRLELTFDPFYIEYGYAAMMNRSFTDRAIAEQTGSGSILGLGARFSLGAATPDTGGAFMQFSYKYRMQSIKKQDKAELGEPITQTDGYPLFGIGYGF
jgi:hypothetical protein